MGGCGAPDQDAPVSIGTGETVIQGRVVRAGAGVPSAYVRLLDRGGDFTGEVQTGTSGGFRFFAAPGAWTLKVLAPGGSGERTVTATQGVTEVTLELA